MFLCVVISRGEINLGVIEVLGFFKDEVRFVWKIKVIKLALFCFLVFGTFFLMYRKSEPPLYFYCT